MSFTLEVYTVHRHRKDTVGVSLFDYVLSSNHKISCRAGITICMSSLIPNPVYRFDLSADLHSCFTDDDLQCQAHFDHINYSVY